MEEPPEGDDGRTMWGIALGYSAVGLELAIGIAGGYLAGRWLDSRFDTKPYLMLLLVLMGTAAGFLSLLRTTRRITRNLEREEENEREESDKEH